MNLRLLLPSFLLILFCYSAAYAGGPLQATGTKPVVWDIANNGPVTLTLDRGPLGQFDSAGAYAIMLDAVLRWDTISTSSLQVKIGGYLDHNVSNANDPILTGVNAGTDGIIPVVFDETGAITDAFLGSGASNQVLGFALPESSDNVTFTEGRIVMGGSNLNRSASRLLTTMTHELGHLLGLSHSQHSMRGITPIMYPSSSVGELHDDDVLAISMLYPVEGNQAIFGSIEGRILDADGNPVSGLNIVAIDSATRTAYATLSDYFSGGLDRFRSPPQKDGSYRFHFLPPGVYFLKVEGISPEFTSGSRLASYNVPINTTAVREWYSGEGENGSMLVDGLNDMVGVRVEAGKTVEGRDVILNDLTSLISVENYEQNGSQFFGVPQTFQGQRSVSYAVRFVAPESGSPASVRVNLRRFSSLPDGGQAIVKVHANQQTPHGDSPGTELGSVTIPFEDLATNQLTDVWLYGLGSTSSFNKGDVFFVSIQTAGTGRLDLEFNAATENPTTYYLDNEDTWRRFPIQGNNGGTRAGNLKMDLTFSTIPSGTQRLLATINPDVVQFDSVETGESKVESALIRNSGTVDVRIDGATIVGADASEFTIVDPPAFPFTLKPGASQSIAVQFLPVSEGAKSAELQLAGNASPTVPLVGWGEVSTVQSLVASIDFGQQLLNNAVRVDTAIIYNRGDVVLAARVAQDVGGDGAFTLIDPTRTILFQPGDSLAVVVEFTPDAERDYQSSLMVTFSPPRDTVLIDVTGQGVSVITSVEDESRVGAGAVSFASLYPNPAQDHAELQFTNNGSVRVTGTLEVVDLNGRMVQHSQLVLPVGLSKPYNVDLRALSPGTYHIIFRSKHGSVVRPMVVVR